MGHVLVQGWTNPERQVARATEFGKKLASCHISGTSFFEDASTVSWKFMHPCVSGLFYDAVGISECMELISRMIGERQIDKHLEGSSCSLTEQFSRHVMFYGNEEKYGNLSRCPNRHSNQNIPRCKLDLCLTVHHQCRQSKTEKPTRCDNNNLLISKNSSTCFGQSFAELQERKTEIYSIWYSVPLW